MIDPFGKTLLTGPLVDQAALNGLLRKVLTYIEEKDGASSDLEDEKDDLYYDALRTIAESGQASISMLQRKLKIGYNRAARIVEIMEKEGVVGPQEVAGKPREVFVDLSQINERQTS